MKKEELRSAIHDIIQAHPMRPNVRKLSLFGSRTRGEEKPESDVDLIVEFHSVVGLFDLAGMQSDLEQALGLPVDLLTPKSISKYIRDDVLRSAEVIYEG